MHHAVTRDDYSDSEMLKFWHLETNEAELPEVMATAGGQWRLRQLLEAKADCRQGLQYDVKCSFYFNYFSAQLQQTKTSDRKLCIF